MMRAFFVLNFVFLTFCLSAGTVSAQTHPDPIPFAQAATACVHQAGDVPEEWRLTWQRTQLWSLYYGYSLAQTFSRTSGAQPANCAANMERLGVVLAKNEDTFAAGWSKARGEGRAQENARILVELNPNYAAGWCSATMREFAAALERQEYALPGLDPASPEGQKSIQALGPEFDDLTLFYDQRSLDEAKASNTGNSAAQDQFLRGANDFEAYLLTIVSNEETVLSVVSAARGAGDSSVALGEVKGLLLTTELAACRAGRRL